MRALLRVGALVGLLGCSSLPEPDTQGLGTECVVDEDCGEGQTCHTYAHPECASGSCTTCEVLCDSDYDCPGDLACNVPPLPPDTVPQICE